MGNTPGFEVFPGFAGAALSITLSNAGAAYGMWLSGAGIAGLGQRKPNSIIKNLLPVIMASILGVYGLIVSVIIIKSITIETYTWQ